MIIGWGTSDEPELNRTLADWAARIIWPEGGRFFGPCRTMGVVDGEDLIGVMVFHNFDPHSGVIEISGASTDRRWLNRQTLWAMFNYPFNDCGCQMVVMRVAADNVMWNGRGLHRLLRSYGFKVIEIPRLFGRDKDGVVFTLTDDDWRRNGFHKEHKHG